MRKRGRSSSRSRERRSRSRDNDDRGDRTDRSGKWVPNKHRNGEYRSRSDGRRSRTGDFRDYGVSFPAKDLELLVFNFSLPETTPEMLKDFLNLAMRESKLIHVSAPDPIIACRLTHTNAIIKFANPEDCTKGLNLTGIPFLSNLLNITRPAGYDGPIHVGMTWQQLTGDNFIPSKEDLQQFPVSSSVTETSERNYRDRTGLPFRRPASDPSTAYYYATKPLKELFIGNVTPQMTNDNLREFLGGALLKMGMASSSTDNPITDIKVTGKFAFIVCATAEDAANMLNLNGIPFLGSNLKLERPSKFDGEVAGTTYFSWNSLYALWHSGELKLMTAGYPSPVLQISNMATAQELLDDSFYLDLIQETRAECSQFGTVKSVIIPRISQQPSTQKLNEKDIGKVFVEMAAVVEARDVLLNLKGRTFSGRCVDVKFYPVENFQAFDYTYESPLVIITSSFGPVPKEDVLTPTALKKLQPF